ncbi:SCO family protein [Paracoccus sediminicola]|uniref:SCO family protein n=1 Tax=Paracoccus sediminicola TaxID=3017783 RepID=UPI0022EFE07F|nr:SCO family protein [Paracoccus sediminicola]WBU56379.1 SCO family protein [Paracoccus sediminicola]
MNDKRLLLLGTSSAAALLVGGWLWMSQTGAGANGDVFANCRTSAVAGGSDAIGGSFELTSETGARVTDKDIITKPSLMYFGFSFCPDICPLDNSRNSEALDLLDDRGINAQALFVTVDPGRDTPEVMDRYTDNMHENMIGLTGSEEDIAAAAKAWRVAYEVQDDGTEDYSVGHTTMTYLVLPEYGTVEFFNRDVTPEEMADTVACFANATS